MNRLARVALLGLTLLLIGLAGGSISAVADSPLNETIADTELAAAEADGEQIQVIVRFADQPATERQEMATEDRLGSMRAHAKESQTTFERFADGNPHVEINRQFWLTNAALVTVDTDRVSLTELGTVEEVTRIHGNYEVETASSAAAHSPSLSPSLASTDEPTFPYGLERINVPETWEAFETRGEGVSVAILDTGVDPDHPDIDIEPDNWAEFDEHGGEVEGSEPSDDDGHGTHVSGIVVGGDASGDHIGVAPEATLYHGAVLTDCDGTTCTGSFSQVLAGMEWAVDNDVDIMSLSLGGTGYFPAFIDPVQNAHEQGTIVVSSSGNSGADSSSSPANVYDAFAVGASDSNDEIASFSSGEVIETEDVWGDEADPEWPEIYTLPDVVAPGVGVTSAVPGGEWDTKDGTSMAAPHVSGAMALVLGTTDRDLTPAELAELFESTAVDLEKDTDRQGKGRIDVFEAALADSREALEPEISPTAVTVDTEVELTVDADHPIDEHRWEIDGEELETTSEPTLMHTFETIGTSEVSVTLIDAGGHEIPASADIEVTGEPTVNQLSVAPADDNYSEIGPKNLAIITTETGAVGDGTTTVAITDSDDTVVFERDISDKTGNRTSHTLEWNATDTDGEPMPSGEYTVTVTADDGFGNEDTDAVAFDVDSDEPTASVVGITRATDGEDIFYAEDENVFYANNESELTIELEADDGRETDTGPVSDLNLTVAALGSNYRLSATELTQDEAEPSQWTATVDPAEIADDGTYELRIGLTDQAKNTTTLTDDDTLEIDRTSPRVSVSVLEYDSQGEEATVRVRTDDSVVEEPTVEFEGESVDLEEDGDGWTGTVEASPGQHTITAEAEDRAGNTGTDETSLQIDSVSTDSVGDESLAGAEDRYQATIYNEATGTFIEFETDEAVTDASVATSESTAPIDSLSTDGEGLTFLTTQLESELEDVLEDATIGFAVDKHNLPAGIAPTDDAVGLEHFVEDAERVDVDVETIDREVDGVSVEGSYWLAIVSEFSTYGLTVEDNEPPTLTGSTPDDSEALSSGTETVDIELTYEDNISGVDASAVELRIDGKDVTGSEDTQITSSTATHENYTVEDGETYAIEIDLVDTVGNDATYERSFSVEREASDDSGGGGGGGSSGSGGGGGGGGGGGSGGSPNLVSLWQTGVSPSTVETGEPVDVTLVIRNSGNALTREPIYVNVSDETIFEHQERLTGGAERTFEFEHVFTEPGEYDLLLESDTLGSRTVGTVTVTGEPIDEDAPEEASDAESDGTSSDDGLNSGDELPGFGPVAALLTLLATVGLLARRR